MKVRKYDTMAWIIDHRGRRYFVVVIGIVGVKKKTYQVTELNIRTNKPQKESNYIFYSLKKVKGFIKQQWEMWQE